MNKPEPTQALDLWSDLKAMKTVKEIYCKGLTPEEIKVFFGIGKRTGCDPFLRELWAVKYGKGPASIFIGRDGYRKGAQRQANYDYHIADVVRANDEFSVVDGKVNHKFKLQDRGEIVGAYCIAQRKGSSKPNYVMVAMSEYYKGQRVSYPDGAIKKKSGQHGSYDAKATTWDTMPETMIKKVAEAQCLRGTWQEIFAGTYGEEEKHPEEKGFAPQEEEKQEAQITEEQKIEILDMGGTVAADMTFSEAMVMLQVLKQKKTEDKKTPEEKPVEDLKESVEKMDDERPKIVAITDEDIERLIAQIGMLTGENFEAFKEGWENVKFDKGYSNDQIVKIDMGFMAKKKALKTIV